MLIILASINFCMGKMTIYIRPHQIDTIKKMEKLRGTTSKSEFILKAVQYMIDTHEKNENDLLTPIDLPTLADDWHIWELYFQGMKLFTLVDNIRKLDQLISLAKQEVDTR